VPIVAGLPEAKPFVGPEELARRVGRTSLVRLGANESAFGPPPRALEAMQVALPEVALYGDPEAIELREALAALHGCEVRNLSVGAGIDDLMGLVVRAYLAPGQVSVATLGSYPTYVYHVLGYGARLEGVPYAGDGRIQLDALAEHAHTTHARVAYLANPDNPSGGFLARAEVERFLDALPADCLLLLDEAYADFVPRAELLPDAIDPRLVRMRTFSKAYGFAGARIAYAIGSPELIATVNKIRLHFNVNRIAQIGALTALGETAFIEGVVADVERGRDEYRAIARARGLGTLPSRTNFVCLDLGSRARAEAMVEALLQRGVFVRKPGLAPIDRFIRVTVGTASQRAAFDTAFGDALAALERGPAVVR
jgi:histidinol-phosphate aminotransferase